MNPDKKRMAPAANQDHPTPTAYEDSLPDHAALVAGVYVAVVQVRGGHVPPRYRRRVLLSLAAAQRLVDKSAMDDLEASIGLYKLVPAGGDDRG